jgi:hypothetical protein
MVSRKSVESKEVSKVIDKNKYKALCYDCIIEDSNICLLTKVREELYSHQIDLLEYVNSLECPDQKIRDE